MPKNVGITVKCCCCEYIGRSDHVKRHIASHRSPPSGWIVSNNPNVIVQETVREEQGGPIKIYRKCACTSCGKVFANPNSNLTNITIAHVCREKVIRNRDYGSKSSKSSDSDKPTVTPMSTTSQTLITNMPKNLSKIRQLTEEQEEKKAQLLATLAESIEDFTEDGVIDYDSVMKQMFTELMVDYITS